MLRLIIKTQTLLDNTIKIFISIIRIIFLSKKPSRIIKSSRAELVILANGPSLNKTLANHFNFLSERDVLCVNFFPNTPYYTQIKPKFTILCAPEIWKENSVERFRTLGKALFTDMAEKTNWEMTFLIPCEARNWKEWQKILSTNKNINVSFFNNTPIEGSRWFRHLMFTLQLGMSRPQNILIPSLHLSLQMGYNKIYIWGADHSWLKELSVDDENNTLINQKHFYDENESKPDTMHKAGIGKRKLHEVLYKFMKSFESYFTIKEYADSLNAKIINNTPDSFIDAFDKERLD